MSKPMLQNPHKNHRENLRNTAAEAGLGALKDHNLLELLLFNALPRRNTNDIAHSILNSCGGLQEALCIDKSSLLSCKNAGEGTALFLNALNEICEDYLRCREFEQTSFSTVGETRNYILGRVRLCSDAVAAIYTLDALHRIKTQRMIKKSSPAYTELLNDAIKDVTSCRCAFAFIAFSHPNGILAPDKSELNFVKSAREAFLSADVKLADVMIVTPLDCRFLSETNILPENFFSGQQRPKGQPINEPIS